MILRAVKAFGYVLIGGLIGGILGGAFIYALVQGLEFLK